ncbi:MAG: hypothetical protein KDA79_16935 [Planctomycetaceae bacterium]|nr:hypothetical protein [Planctomycetaceae bacterium]
MMCTGSMANLIVTLEAGSAVRTYVQRSGSPGQTMFLVSAVLGAVGLWLVIYWWDRQRNLPRPDVGVRSGSLFEQLCRRHQLSPADRRLLEQAAGSIQLAQPAFLFIDASLLRQLSQAGEPEAEPQTARYAELFQKLFTEPEPQ